MSIQFDRTNYKRFADTFAGRVSAWNTYNHPSGWSATTGIGPMGRGRLNKTGNVMKWATKKARENPSDQFEYRPYEGTSEEEAEKIRAELAKLNQEDL